MDFKNAQLYYLVSVIFILPV